MDMYIYIYIYKVNNMVSGLWQFIRSLTATQNLPGGLGECSGKALPLSPSLVFGHEVLLRLDDLGDALLLGSRPSLKPMPCLGRL